MLKKKFLKIIKDYFSSCSVTGKATLHNGDIGLMYILFSLYRDNPCAKELDVARELLSNFLSSYSSMPSSLIKGKWGLLWVLSQLIKDDIISDSSFISGIIRNISSDYLNYMHSSPLHINVNDDIFSQGFCALQQIDKQETLEYYFLLEKIISMIDDCETLLLPQKKYFYHPSSLDGLYIVSLMVFLDAVYHIYPTKVDLLRRTIMNSMDIYNWDNDSKLLFAFNTGCPIQNITISDLNQLSSVGFYCHLFKTPNVIIKILDILDDSDSTHKQNFITALKKCNDQSTMQGIALGLLTEYNGLYEI